jgi:hypothetical protein
MDENIKQLMYELATMPHGDAIKMFIEEKIAKLSDITNIAGSLEEKGRMVEAHSEAIKILRELFQFLGGRTEKSKRNQYE